MVMIVSVGEVYKASSDSHPGIIGIGSTARAAVNHFWRLVTEFGILRATMA